MTCVTIRSGFLALDTKMLRLVPESRKHYLSHLSTSYAVAVDNMD